LGAGAAGGLSEAEREAVLAILNGPRFADSTPREAYGTLLTEGLYMCHWRTMYRILGQFHQVRERRDQLRHPAYHKPQLLAQAPNQVWSWDITRLLSFSKWAYFYLYVILDIFSRFVVGWMVADVASRCRVGGAGAALHLPHMRPARHSAGSVDHSRRSRQSDDGQDHRATLRRPRRGGESFAPARLG
jgi:hypothetical protein